MPNSRPPATRRRDEFIAVASVRARGRVARLLARARASRSARRARTGARLVARSPFGVDARSCHQPACPAAELQTARNATNSSRARLVRARGRRATAARARARTRAPNADRARLVARTLRPVSMLGRIIGPHAQQQSSKRLGTRRPIAGVSFARARSRAAAFARPRSRGRARARAPRSCAPTRTRDPTRKLGFAIVDD